MPAVLWRRNRYAKWLMVGWMVLWTCVLWVISRDGRRFWPSEIYLLIFPLQWYAMGINARYLLAGGVLSVVRGSAVQRVPLAAAELQRNGSRFRLRWPDGRRQRTLSLTLPAPFADALERTALSARSAEAGSVPATTAEAARAVTFAFPVKRNLGTWISVGLFAFLGLFGLAVWLNQPLLLLPLSVLAWLVGSGPVLLLCGDHLWLIRPDAEPHPIPVTAVQQTNSGLQTTVIVTEDAAYPEIRVNLYQSNDLLKQLKRRGKPM